MPFVPVVTNDIIYAQDVQLINAALQVGALGQGKQELVAGTTPTVATGAAGALTGTYHYAVTFAYARKADNSILGESLPSPTSGAVAPAAQRVTVSAIPVSANPLCNARRIYRTAAGGTQLKLVTTIFDNTTTTYSDNLADGSLGANVPTIDTSDGSLWSTQVALWNQFIGVNS